jgi:hypothetical protein
MSRILLGGIGVLMAVQLLWAKPGDMKPGTAPADLSKELNPASENAAEATSEVDKELDKQVRKLLKELESSTLSKRDAAEATLLKLGPKALGYLPKESEITNAGVQQSLKRVREKLEVALADTVKNASTVNLKGKHTLKAILTELTLQTGNKFHQVEQLPPEVLNQSLDVSWEEKPFWPALDQVLDHFKMTVYPYQAAPGLMLIPRPKLQIERGDQGGYAGPLRFEVQRISLEREPNEATPPRMRVGLGIAWEPRIKPISIEMPLAKSRAIDDQAKIWDSLRNEGVASSLTHQGASGTELEAIIEAPARSATTLSSVQGQVRLLLPGRQEQFVFDNLQEISKPEQKREIKIGQATVTVERLVKTNDIWELQMKLTYEQAFEAFDSHLAGWVLQYQPTFTDAQGKVHNHEGFETALRNDKEFGITFLYDVPEIAGAKWQFGLPASLQRLEYDFEIKNVRLP